MTSPEPGSLPFATLDSLLRQRESLCEVIESINSDLELRPLLTRIIRHATELLHTTTGSIALYDEERDLVRIEADFNMPPDNVGRELGPGVGLGGLVLKTRQPVVLDRLEQVPRIVDTRFSEHAALGVPIFWRDQFIGSFGVSSLPPRRFTSDDVATLSVYARHAAMAIQNARQYEREASRSRRLTLLARIGHELAADLELDTLCAHAVQLVHELLGFPNVGLGLIEPGKPETIVIRHLGGGFERAVPYERRIHIDQGIMGAAARERRTQLVQDVRQDPRYLAPPFEGNILAELAVPVIHGGEVLGVLNIEGHRRFDEDDEIEAQIVADHLAVAIRNARLFLDVERLGALVERQRLARELHDSITQLVFSANLFAQSIVPAWRGDPAEGERLSNRVVELTRSALVELRALLRELSPPDGDLSVADNGEGLPALERLRRSGLAEMIRAEARQAVDGRLACELVLHDYRAQPPEIEEMLYRVFQEALHNVVKHARATWVQVSLRSADGEATLRVSDNGMGFDPGAVTSGHHGLGLRNMRERAKAAGGTVCVNSHPGSGTRVEATVPSRQAL